jgi:hypothetical protein
MILDWQQFLVSGCIGVPKVKAVLLTEKTGDSGRSYPEGTEVTVLEPLGRRGSAFGREMPFAVEGFRVEVYGASGYDQIVVRREEIDL